MYEKSVAAVKTLAEVPAEGPRYVWSWDVSCASRAVIEAAIAPPVRGATTADAESVPSAVLIAAANACVCVISACIEALLPFTAAQPLADGCAAHRVARRLRLSAAVTNAAYTTALDDAAIPRERAGTNPTLASWVESALTEMRMLRRVWMIGTMMPTLSRRVIPSSSAIGVVTVRMSLCASRWPSVSRVSGLAVSVWRPACTGARRGNWDGPRESVAMSSLMERVPLPVKRSS